MPRIGETSEVFRCDLCIKSQKQARHLITDDDVYICDEYIGLCNRIIGEEFPRVETFRLQERLSKPKEIRDSLDQYVAGQDTAKEAFTVAVYNHYKRITSEQAYIGHSRQSEEPVGVGESNILLIGSTGYGRTYLAQALARILDMPFVVADATAFTEARYVDEDVRNILLKLIQAIDFGTEKAETGIIYIDETDKAARKSKNPSVARNISGEGVQQVLFKILKGTVASVPPRDGRKHPHQGFLQINTTKILFAVGGAFAGPDKIINSRIEERLLRFSIDTSTWKEATNPFSGVHPEGLHKFSLVPEFIGHLPMISTVSPPGREALSWILVEPRNILTKRSARFFELDGVQLDLTDEAIDAIAGLVLGHNARTRGLRTIPKELLLDVMFEVPSTEDVVQVIVTREVVLGETQPELVASSRVIRHRDLSV